MTSFQQQEGFNFVEVIISVVISSIALIGLAGLHVSSINTSTVAHAKLHAIQMMSEMADQMRANVEAAKQGAFNIEAASASRLKTFSEMGVVPEDTAPAIEKIKYYWFQNLDSLLPNVTSAISCDATGECVLKVKYANMDRNRLATDTDLEQVLAIQL